MSHIKDITIQNYRGIKNLYQDFGDEKFIVLIGRGDSGKSTILSAVHAVLSLLKTEQTHPKKKSKRE